jgi:hypothetical protein
MLAPAAMPNDTRFQMMTEQLDAERIEGGTNGRNLVQNIDAVAVIVDHSLDSGNLSPNTADAMRELDFVWRLHMGTYTPTGYTSIASCSDFIFL